MGCDIHLYMEYRTSKGESWHAIAAGEFYQPRYYHYFSLLAGVRQRDIEQPVFQPRGLPSDLGYQVQSEWDGGRMDWHTASFLSPNELEAVCAALEGEVNFETTAVLALARLYEANGQEVRFVFWFDN